MADTNIGTAYVKIMPSAKGISGEISKQMAPEAKSSGISVGKVFSAGLKIAAAAAGVAIVKFFKDSIDAGAELEQNLGGTEAVFGDFAKNVQERASEAYKNMGLSASDYMATANKMGSLFQGSGLSQQKSLELTTQAMQRAADVASVMGIDTTTAMESIAGAAKGNFTMMDNLGVAMNATTLAAYALEKGVNFDWNTASNAEKAELAMQMFMERTQQYEGNFARESEETFSGSLGAMKAAATNFIATLSLGGDIQKPLGEMVESAKTFLFGNLIPMVWNIIKEIPGIIGTGLMDLFTNLPGLVDSAINFIHSFTESIRDNSGEFFDAIAALGQAAWTALTETDWIGLGGAILEFLWTGITTLAPKIWEGLKAIAMKAAEWFQSVDWPAVGMAIVRFIGDAIGSVGRWIWDKISSIGETAAQTFKDVDWVEAGQSAFHTLVDAISNIGSYLWDAIKTLGETAAEHFKGIEWGEVGHNVLTSIANGITAVGSFLYEAFSTAATNAIDTFKNTDWEQAGKDAINFVINGVKNIATNLWEAIKTIGTTAGEKLSELDWKQLGIDILTAIKDGLVSVGQFLWGALQEIGSNALDAILNLSWVQTGIDVVNGIIEGIKEFGSQIGETIVGFAKDALTKIKDFFKIGSPSKLMRDAIGRWIPLGIAEGIESEKDSVLTAMDDIAKEASGVNITPTVSYSPLAALRGAVGDVTMNFTVNGAEVPEEWANRVGRALLVEARMMA